MLTYFKEYKKTYDFASIVNDQNKNSIIDYLRSAVRNAQSLEKWHEKNNGVYDPLNCNPSSQVYQIIIKLFEFAKI